MSASNKLRAALGAMLLWTGAAGAAGAARLEDTVAFVNGSPILLSEYRKELATSMAYWRKTEPGALDDPENLDKLRKSTLEEMINRELLYQEGVKEKIKVRDRDIENGIEEIKARFAPEDAKDLPPGDADAQAEKAFDKQLKSDGLTMAQFRHRLSKQIMARKLIDQDVRSTVQQPSEKEVRAYFDKVQAFLASGSTQPPGGFSPDDAQAFLEIAGQVKAVSSERVRVSRILIRTLPNASVNEKKRALETAQAIRKKLLDGASFAEVARAQSEDPESAPRGGDIGYVVRGVAPPAFEEAAFSLPVGQISEPIQTEEGYNIILVSEKRAAQSPDFDKLKDDMGRFLMNLRFQKDLQAYVKKLRSKAFIKRNLQAAR
ncbi:MAG: peptidylprolyl isomerase [Elusimicrobia bacterium]|nr:peptidylprolyl isomerase [Elusimicrobiota bacterium]MDE2426165.1 peptidylprolyl isomerase [Elusimicrobiota bacterium]